MCIRDRVKIKLLVRGVCCLVPGIENLSDNIEVFSIVDRYLEHGRIFIFANGNEESIYIGSADLMTRNLDHRIEVITPLLDPDIKQRVRKTVDLQFEEGVKRRIIDENQLNNYVSLDEDINQSSQHLIYEYLKNKI